jgi:NAD(P)-dependent dehydrogenase (short-subunit alcohol dehydrogenase family)
MITEGFVLNGAKVYICSRKKETIQKTADALTKRGISLKRKGLMVGPGVCIAFQADLSTFEGCVQLAKDMETNEKRIPCHSILKLTFPDLDVLVHNSGNNWGAPLEEYVSPYPSRALIVARLSLVQSPRTKPPETIYSDSKVTPAPS